LMFQLGVAVIVAALGVVALSRLYSVTAPYGVYLGLIAANCLILEYVQVCTGPRTATRDLLEALGMCAAIWIPLVAFGAIREILATGSVHLDATRDGVNIGSIPLAASPAGALILLGLVVAAANALRGTAPAGVEQSAVAKPETAA
jgi:Na+-translocating ferredoxin:NAD+ oxidoreductase subunit E